MSALLLAGLLVIVGLATAWNLEGWPGRVDDDEGTYVAQAWAIIYEHTLTHYAYWYDHPPGGWIQIAAFAWVTDGFNRVTDAIFVGRQFMVVVTLICCVLVWVLCRRLGMRQATSAVAVLLFGLSPIGQYYHRLVSLDNVETMWVLAALVAATSPRRGWGPAVRTGACAAIAILSKETALIFLPVIFWVLWQHGARPADAAAAAVTPADVAPADSAGPAGPTRPAGSRADLTATRADDSGWRTTPGPAGVPGTDGAYYGSPAGTGPAGESSGWYDRTAPSGSTASSASAASSASTGPESAEAPVWMPDWSAFRQRQRDRRAGVLPREQRRPTAKAAKAATPAAPVSRGQSFAAFAVTLCLILLLYPLYALQRGQLPALWSALKFQFLNRPGSGSLLDSGSYTYSLVHTWLTTDPWLLYGGFAAALLMLFSRRLRPFSVALLLQVLVLLHGGYLPYFYVTAVIPFAAVLLAGTADTLWTKTDFSRGGTRSAQGGAGGLAYLGRAVVAVAAIVAVVVVAPSWWRSLNTNSTANGDAPYLAAASWAEHNVPKNDTVVVDDYLWVDLKTHGLNPLWIWKITSQTAPSWKSIQYIILQPQSPATLASMPALQTAYKHSVQVKNFGNGLTVRRVKGAR